MTKSVTTLDDKYVQTHGRVFLSSNQALVRLPLDQSRRDRALGLRTAGYISGYRGSPLGVYDSALWGAQKLLDTHDIRFQPGLNEELAVSGIRGTQELGWFGNSDFEGVFGLWYGKGIGVDRACESLKLGNFEGAAMKGGFLAIAGDDHGGKSSDSAHQSEHTLIAAMLPILYPATVGEVIEFGLFGWAMSRYSGCYVGLKCITDTLDLTASIELSDPHRVYATPADLVLPPGGLNLKPNQPALVEEDLLVNHRLPAATAFARTNGIDRVVIEAPRRCLALVAAGKAYLDLRQALADLGLDDAHCARLGTSHIRIGPDPAGIYSSRLAEGMTDVLIACDLIVASGTPVLRSLKPGRSAAVLNTDVSPTGDFQSKKHLDLNEARLREALVDALAGGAEHALPASKLATELTGDSIGTNILMLGYAAQKGLLPGAGCWYSNNSM